MNIQLVGCIFIASRSELCDTKKQHRTPSVQYLKISLVKPPTLGIYATRHCNREILSKRKEKSKRKRNVYIFPLPHTKTAL